LIEERSAGAVVFHSLKERREYLLLSNRGKLDFPKGQIEDGEDEISAAKREAREETGLILEFVDGFRENVSYFYARPGGERVHKVVTFFVAESKSPEVRISKEHQGYFWLPLEEALRRASYSTSKVLLAKADGFIRSRLMQSRLDLFK
jgi:bis(5'-nucleosidyl)-tetraphosphatase